MTQSIGHRIKAKLKNAGADFVQFVDITQLSATQNKSYPHAILFGMYLSPEFLLEVFNTPNYAEKMKRNKMVNKDEFAIKEKNTDSIADKLSEYILELGYSAYSQSEDNVAKTGFYDLVNKSTPLPLKTMAGIAGLGWIGKNNLLITPDYGCAIVMCSVLTDAPLAVVSKDSISSKCGDCDICIDVCEVNAIKGKTWEPGIIRDELVDVNLCNTCIRCMVSCPWTQKYMNRELGEL